MTFATYFNPGVSLQGGSGSSGTASLPITGNGATVTASTPLIDGTQTWNNAAVTFTALKINVTSTASAAASLLMDLQAGSASKFSVDKSGNVGLYASSAVRLGSSTVNWQLTLATTGIIQSSANYYGFYDGTNLAAGGSVDTRLYRDAANTLALRNTTAAQAFNIYNTYTSGTSYERYSVDWITTANLVIVGPNKGSGGGTQRVQRLSYLEDGGAGSTVPLLGSTCPAASGTVKSWIKVITSDGTTAYIPCWA